jgi:hypothetical protein
MCSNAAKTLKVLINRTSLTWIKTEKKNYKGDEIGPGHTSYFENCPRRFGANDHVRQNLNSPAFRLGTGNSCGKRTQICLCTHTQLQKIIPAIRTDLDHSVTSSPKMRLTFRTAVYQPVFTSSYALSTFCTTNGVVNSITSWQSGYNEQHHLFHRGTVTKIMQFKTKWGN